MTLREVWVRLMPKVPKIYFGISTQRSSGYTNKFSETTTHSSLKTNEKVNELIPQDFVGVSIFLSTDIKANVFQNKKNVETIEKWCIVIILKPAVSSF